MIKYISSLEVFSKIYQDRPADVSVVMPCFNQEKIIQSVLSGVITSMRSHFELIVIDDHSSDNSLIKIISFFENLNPNDSRLIEVKVFRNKKPMYETWCDDFGFRIARGKFLLEIQADMFINDPGFDLRMIDSLEKNPDVFAISGRGVHDLGTVIDTYSRSLGTDRAYSKNLILFAFKLFSKRLLGKIRYLISSKTYSNSLQVISDQLRASSIDLESVFPSNEVFKSSKCAGLLGDYIELVGIDFDNTQPLLYLGETIMRGPLMFSAAHYFKLGGLNTRGFYQGFDDHDLMYRAFSEFDLRCGYLPTKVSSRLEHGSTRKPRSLSGDINIYLKTVRISFSRRKSPLFRAAKGAKIDVPNSVIRNLNLTE